MEKITLPGLEKEKIDSEITSMQEYLEVLKKAPRTLLMVCGIFSAEGANAVEIPPNASYSEGIELLRQGSLEDGFETGALYIEFDNGKGIWYSQEGDENTAPDFAGEAKHESNLKELFNGIKEKQNLIVHSIHNHPGHKDGASAPPPSGQGYAVPYGGDTSVMLLAWRNAEWDEFQEENNVSFSIVNKMVNGEGVWTYRLDSELVSPELNNGHLREAIQTLAEWNGGLNKESESIIEGLHSEHKQALKQHGAYLYSLQANWGDVVPNLDVEISQSKEFKELTRAYSNVGVAIEFSPFPKSE